MSSSQWGMHLIKAGVQCPHIPKAVVSLSQWNWTGASQILGCHGNCTNDTFGFKNKIVIMYHWGTSDNIANNCSAAFSFCIILYQLPLKTFLPFDGAYTQNT